MSRKIVAIGVGAHIKVKNVPSLELYFIHSATWGKVRLPSQNSTPKLFLK